MHGLISIRIQTIETDLTVTPNLALLRTGPVPGLEDAVAVAAHPTPPPANHNHTRHRVCAFTLCSSDARIALRR